MIKFKTKATWVLLFVCIISSFMIIYYIGSAFEFWAEDKTKSLGSLNLAGIIAEIAGFVILLHPKIIRIFTKKESDLQYEGIGFVIVGLVIQAIAVHLSL